jgi:16S rRNA (uracil1498-N3)-methyltransferase
MTRRRWIADKVEADRAFLIGAHAEHLARVLRAQVGQEFEVASGDSVRLARITAISDDAVEFALGEVIPAASLPEITLLLAIFKFDRMEWAIEKCTELGVARIIPVIARRTDAHLASASEKRAERWERIALQASEQSRRSLPPSIESPLKLDAAARLTWDARIVLAETERSHSLVDQLRACSTSGSLALAVGPEGGWTPEEIARFTAEGWLAATLGSTILRAETAAIAALAVTVAHLADTSESRTE